MDSHKKASGNEKSFAGKRVTIIGLAREGVALVRHLAPQGAEITVSDIKPREKLIDAIELLSPFDVRLALGGHPEDILDCDHLFVSPGVPLNIPILQEAVRRGIPLNGESRFFLERCPSPVIGITGSSGKTTTVSLTGKMLAAAGFKTWVGGNIGEPLTPYLNEMNPEDKVVMELSSFQLQIMRRSPEIGCILNITPNHLDRHASMEEYTEAKANILRFQKPDDVAVLGYDNDITRNLANSAKGKAVFFSLKSEVREGAFLRDQQVILRWEGQEHVVCHERDVQLRGRHNIENVLAACAISGSAGAGSKAMHEVISSFTGVEHRLEFVRELNGTGYYNDSIATSPERTMAALRAFEQPVVLLTGGQDKHLPWDELASLMLERTRGIVLFGQAAGIIEKALDRAMSKSQASTDELPAIRHAGSLEEAVSIARQLAQPGDVVLLSPGGTSFDAFKDFEERGAFFKALVKSL